MASAQELCVSPHQRDLHILTEALAVVVIAPFLGYVATRPRELTTFERVGIWGIVAGTLLVDGFLLYRWWSSTR